MREVKKRSVHVVHHISGMNQALNTETFNPTLENISFE